jgi:hypothetical protein
VAVLIEIPYGYIGGFTTDCVTSTALERAVSVAEDDYDGSRSAPIEINTRQVQFAVTIKVCDDKLGVNGYSSGRDDRRTEGAVAVA